MADKRDFIKERNSVIVEKLIKNLEERKFEAYYCDNKSEANEKIKELIKDNSSVSWGGSKSIEELGIKDYLYNGNYTIVDRDKSNSLEERQDLMRKAFFVDYYLTSSNALSLDGTLVNIDGMGNRVAAMCFGPKNVIVVISINKVCKNLEQARERARNYASILNAERFSMNPNGKKMKTPCVNTGFCGDCKSDDCICSYIVETRFSMQKNRIKVIVVGEELGF